MSSLLRATIVSCSVVSCAVFAATAADRPFTVEPGATTISAEEAAIAADPSKGVEGAVILLDETDRDESPVGSGEVAYHRRAKILSNEARGLADITIPYDTTHGKLVKWWGRTILPDGTVLSLHEEELKSQSAANVVGYWSSVLKGALPGVVPGAVIDYGYVFRLNYLPYATTVAIEGKWPVRQLRYRWVPYKGMKSAYLVVNTQGKPVEVKPSSEGVVITATGTLPVPWEPLMPPSATTHAAALLYYLERGAESSPQAFWDLEAKRADREVGEFATKSALKSMMASMAVPPELPLPDKLKRAYDWLAANIKNTGTNSAEETDAAVETKKDRNRERNLARLLDKKDGYTGEIAVTFVLAARELGATAHIVFAADRSERFWNPALLSLNQLEWRLVEIVGADGSTTVVAPGSGLAYGRVPWWLTGVSALAADPKGARAIIVPPSDAAVNALEAEVKLSFSDENDTLLASWTSHGQGQWGYSARRSLRRGGPEERTRQVNTLCGSSRDVEIVEASAPGFDDLNQPFTLACSIERTGLNIAEKVTDFAFSYGGPWIESLPDLTAPQRSFPVIFDFPRTEHRVIDVASPHGFVPKAPLRRVDLESPFGHYTRVVTATPEGFRVERTLSITPLIVKPNNYDPLRRWLADVRKSDQEPLQFKRGAAAAGSPQ